MTKAIHLLPMLTGAAIALLSCAGLAVYVGWIPTPVGVHTTADHAAATQVCGRCGVIESVREAPADAASRGTLTGAPLGQQLVGFSRDLTNVIGLLMVAMAGRPETGAATLREIVVRFDDGSSRVLIENSPSWKAGDRVKVVNGRIRPYPELPGPLANAGS